MTFDSRKTVASNLLSKYDRCIPVVLTSRTIELSSRKFIIPSYLSIGQFVFFLRKHIKLSAEQALFLYVEMLDLNEKTIQCVLPPASDTIEAVYDKFKHVDFLLYFFVETENAFG